MEQPNEFIHSTAEYERISRALQHIGESEGMAMAVLHYFKPGKGGINSVILSSVMAGPMTQMIVNGVDQAAADADVEIICECGCEEGAPIGEERVGVIEALRAFLGNEALQRDVDDDDEDDEGPDFSLMREVI